ncbi:NrsF family protein [Blastomonas sp. SL216]|uniref:NrsF family protein n=1 Tax=Blastomonas sp. SL216 TaxID=2995169 RepID=UPI0023775BE3|nr:DUF1109 domain-containing protein [Blastomonas sp. SL216]
MNHQALIQALCDDLTPVKTASFEQQLGRGIGLGGLASMGILLFSLGVQQGLANLSVIVPLAVKLGSMLAIAAIALRAMRSLARPGRPAEPLLAPIGMVALIVLAIALGQSRSTPPQAEAMAWFGASWQACSLRITALSLPLIVGIGWAVRRQAPVHLAQAGAVCGLAAGALSAAIYALACSEPSAGFVLLWYSLGIAGASAIGALAGPHLLRW